MAPTKIDGGFKSPKGNVYFYTPGVLLGLAATLAGFNGSEAAVFRLCEIHAFGHPNPERKSTLTRLSRAFITNNVGVVKSAADKALNTLLQRQVILEKGNGSLVINKWIDEWLDSAGRPIFYEGSKAMAKMLASLERCEWWNFPAAFVANLAPAKRTRGTRQLPFQSSDEDRAESVPTSIEDDENSEMTSDEDENWQGLTSDEDEKTPEEDNQPAETHENGRSTRRREGDWPRFGSALSGDGRPLADVAGFAEAKCWKGQKVCDEVSRYAAHFAHDQWVLAFQELANFPSPETLESPTALVLARVKNPRRCKYQAPVTFADWMHEHTQPQDESDEEATTKSGLEQGQADAGDTLTTREDRRQARTDDESLADAFLSRPSADQNTAIAQLKASKATDNAGKQRRHFAMVLEHWAKKGRPDWREHGNHARPYIEALAAGEQAARVYHERQAPTVETYQVKVPRR